MRCDYTAPDAQRPSNEIYGNASEQEALERGTRGGEKTARRIPKRVNNPVTPKDLPKSLMLRVRPHATRHFHPTFIWLCEVS